jgi:hypothetical protein
MASMSIGHGGLNMLPTWNTLTKILRVTLAFVANADQTARVSYWGEQPNKGSSEETVFVSHETAIDAVLSANSERSTSRWGEKTNDEHKSRSGEGKIIETNETKKVHRYVYGDGAMGEFSIKHLCLVDCRVNNNNNTQYE